MTLVHIHREMLELAANADKGPVMPPSADIEATVRVLIQRGLLDIIDGVVKITPAGRQAFAA